MSSFQEGLTHSKSAVTLLPSWLWINQVWNVQLDLPKQRMKRLRWPPGVPQSLSAFSPPRHRWKVPNQSPALCWKIGTLLYWPIVVQSTLGFATSLCPNTKYRSVGKLTAWPLDIASRWSLNEKKQFKCVRFKLDIAISTSCYLLITVQWIDFERYWTAPEKWLVVGAGYDPRVTF